MTTLLVKVPRIAPLLTPGNPDTMEMLGWLGVIVLGAVIIGLIGYQAHKKLKVNVDTDDAAPVFTLDDLRRMHRQGHLTDEEYEVAKAKVLAEYQAAEAGAAGEESGNEDEGDGIIYFEADDDEAPEDDATHDGDKPPE